MRPVVAIIVRTYNRAELLERSLRSLFDQEYPDLRIIVVDDGSTDGSAALLATLREQHLLTVIRHPRNRGVTAAGNSGLDALAGDVVLFGFHDSDDILLPGAVDTLVTAFEPVADQYSTIAAWSADAHTLALQGTFRTREGTVTYDDLLAGRVTGDFFKLARRDLLGSLRFDERASGGETAVWGPLLRRLPLLLLADVVAHVDRSSADRVSRTVIDRGRALGKMHVYTAILAAYGRDMRASYPEQYAGHLQELAKWAALAGEGGTARRSSREALRIQPSVRATLLALTTLLPEPAFRVVYRLRRGDGDGSLADRGRRRLNRPR